MEVELPRGTTIRWNLAGGTTLAPPSPRPLESVEVWLKGGTQKGGTCQFLNDERVVTMKALTPGQHQE